MLDADIKELEDYSQDLESWSEESNSYTFDVDVALTKEKLEVLVCNLQMGYLDEDHIDISFLTELKEDLKNKPKVLEAINNIISTIKGECL